MDFASSSDAEGARFHMGNGNGTFYQAAGSSYSLLGLNPNEVASGDFNGDGLDDVAIVSTADSSALIYLSNGDGTFSFGSTRSLGSLPNDLYQKEFRVGDVNNDGLDDLIVSGGGMRTYLSQGDGTFSEAITSSPGGGHIEIVDLNGDGVLDITESRSDVRIYYGLTEESITSLLHKVCK